MTVRHLKTEDAARARAEANVRRDCEAALAILKDMGAASISVADVAQIASMIGDERVNAGGE